MKSIFTYVLKIVLTILIIYFSGLVSENIIEVEKTGKDLSIFSILLFLLMVGSIYVVWRYIPSNKKTIKNTSSDSSEEPKRSSYFDSVTKIRKDGFYFLKDDIIVSVISFLEKGEVSFFSQIDLDIGKSIGELYFVEKDIKQQINNESNWSEYSCIEGIAKKAYFENKGKRIIITCKLKRNGQIQVYKQNFEPNGETSTEWADYDFQKFKFKV